MSFATLFKSQAKAYSQFRPVYPQALYDAVFEFLGKGKPGLPSGLKGRVAVDVATGNGQAALAISKHFERVYAFDATPEQVEQAPKADNVTFAVGEAEAIDVADGSVDLLTCAQALHWFDLSKFYPEALRALSPGGVLAVWGYETCDLEHPRANAEFYRVYDEVLGPYWSPRRKLVEAKYKGLEPEQSDDGFVAVERLLVPLEVEMSVADFCGYLSTWSAYATFKSKQPQSRDPIEEFGERLLIILSGQDPGPYNPMVAEHVAESAADSEAEAKEAAAAAAESPTPKATMDTIIKVTFPIFGFLARKAEA